MSEQNQLQPLPESLQRQLEWINSRAMLHGLSLSPGQLLRLEDKRREALLATGRFEVGPGILPELMEAFCDSPFLEQDSIEEAMADLMDCFYYFKNESTDRIPDDELIAFMKRQFNGICQGSLEYLAGTSLEELCRHTRYDRRRPQWGET